MERRAKERLIGASILVALLVLIVPELLSGPKPPAPAAQPPRLPAAASTPEPIRTVTVDLATSKAPAAEEGDAAAPAQAAQPPAASAVPESIAGQAASPANSPPQNAPSMQSPQHPAAAMHAAPIESQQLSPISKAGTAHGEASHSPGWSVQLGSFASRANADNLVHQLKAQGFNVYVLSGGSGAAARHRVRVGPLNDREAAERTAAKLKTLGHASSLVAPAA